MQGLLLGGKEGREESSNEEMFSLRVGVKLNMSMGVSCYSSQERSISTQLESMGS